MFDPQKIFPIVRKSMTKGTDEQVMQALSKFGAAHPQLDDMQALAALQKFMQDQGPQQQQSPVQSYLSGGK